MSYTTEQVWDIFCCKLKPYIKSLGVNEFTADDIVQDVFIKIHEKINTLKDDAKIHSWVLNITRNTVYDCFRKHKIHFTEIDELKINPKHFGVTNIEDDKPNLNSEITSGLRSIVESLPNKYAEAILKVEYEGVSQINYAKELNISPSGAKSRVQRARKMIKDQLMNCCHYEFDKYGTAISVKPLDCCCCK